MVVMAILVLWPGLFEQLFVSLSLEAIYEILLQLVTVSKEKPFERMDGRRTSDNGACLIYKLPRSLRLVRAKKGDRI